ncbi:C40 family peptidase [Nocardioidaceae bacterium SCSIO 66511]|nr:C40 family peptidase [Nocardioidaceae bacterium SCSIO 66511]
MTTVIATPVTTVWTSPDAPRDIDAAIVASTPDPVAWNTALLDAPPSALHGRTETQAVLGEPVRIVSERDGWLEVVLPWQPSSKDPDGYPGWVPAAHVAELDPTDAPLAVVTTLVAETSNGAISYGTVLPELERTPDVVRLAAPGGPIELAASSTDRVPQPADVRDVTSLLASAGQFVGMRYLWGGTSGWGVDCSGFVHLTHRRFGVTVPRDAHDQYDASAQLNPRSAVAGDLYFFGRTSRGITHVGFATGEAGETAQMLHAPDGDRQQHVEHAPMAKERADNLAGAGSFLHR